MLQELTDQELNETEGGLIPLIIAVVVIAVVLCSEPMCAKAY